MAPPDGLEPAIAPHLQQERTVPARLPSTDYQPPFPSYSARFSEELKDLVMAVIGVQHPDGSNGLSNEFEKIRSFVENPTVQCSPRHWEAASVVDSSGYFNEVAIVYWRSRREFEEWRSESGFDEWWKGLEVEESHGWFLEVFLPSIDRFETVFSDNVVTEGAGHMQESISGPIQQHVYWGSMRDRLPASQTDHLTGEKTPEGVHDTNSSLADTRTRRIRVTGRQNLAIIRSGQDWSNTKPLEREKYLNTMHPVLIRGMDFLRDKGDEVGCFSCRLMDVVDKTSPATSTDKTFALAYFDDLASLEGWSKAHKTHLDIFGRFLQYAAELENDISLRLFHEVMVLEPEQQILEYIGCHEGTGMLASMNRGTASPTTNTMDSVSSKI
ncbi:hypothetical protein LTR09_011443 [Extremus antarcticus]|uniref:Phenylacetaldoxime dehydratase n=1 Tax=Extremus antarcticus TaxID=702011 RepID=A0AAJ0D6C2_9PEZI|nr:hypothetical protein LTR09_011443 [Extremus antarcticus]